MVKIAYLTIDDAPSSDFKRKVDYLYKQKIPAIFFCIGKLLDKRPKDIIYAIKKGFIIGNHSYDHPYFSFITLKKAYEQIRKTDDLIEDLYKKAGKKRPIKVFRFPFLRKGGLNRRAIQEVLKKLGYIQPKFDNINYKWYKRKGFLKDIDVYPSYDTMDWTTIEKRPIFGVRGLQEVLARIDEDVPEGCRGINYKDSNDIIMMHDYNNPKHTKMFIPMIEKLKSKVKFKMPEIK